MHCVCGVVIVCQLLNTKGIFTVALVHVMPQILRSPCEVQVVALICEADWLAALECFLKRCPVSLPVPWFSSALSAGHIFGGQMDVTLLESMATILVWSTSSSYTKTSRIVLETLSSKVMHFQISGFV